MARVLNYLISGCIFLLLSGSESIDAAPLGFMEGHLKILLSREVDLADGTPASATAETYAKYPLIVLSYDGKKEIARVTADGNGNYRLALPPGDYILDVQGRPPKGTATVYGYLKSDCSRRYGYRYRHSVSRHSQDAILSRVGENFAAQLTNGSGWD